MPSVNADQVHADLLEMLVSGEYAPGDRLTEQSLAERLGMSRTPVREALQRLQATGLVERGFGGGMVVAEMTAAEVAAAYDVREALEVLVVRRAAEAHARGEIAPAALASLRALNDTMTDAERDGRLAEAALLNARFHERLAELGGNPIAEAALGRLRDRFLVGTRTNLEQAEWQQASHDQHIAILDAIGTGEADAAEAALREHTDSARRGG